MVDPHQTEGGAEDLIATPYWWTAKASLLAGAELREGDRLSRRDSVPGVCPVAMAREPALEQRELADLHAPSSANFLPMRTIMCATSSLSFRASTAWSAARIAVVVAVDAPGGLEEGDAVHVARLAHDGRDELARLASVGDHSLWSADSSPLENEKEPTGSIESANCRSRASAACRCGAAPPGIGGRRGAVLVGDAWGVASAAAEQPAHLLGAR